MKRLILLLLIASPSALAQNHNYTTAFPLTENPICENEGSGCIWVNGNNSPGGGASCWM